MTEICMALLELLRTRPVLFTRSCGFAHPLFAPQPRVNSGDATPRLGYTCRFSLLFTPF